MPSIKPYNRSDAIAYATQWALSRNPRFFDFTNLGGDCTNFISQCVYAGSKVMNFRKTFGWYYNSPTDRTPSWTGVTYFYNFMTTNKLRGPFASEVDLTNIIPGDVIQLRNIAGEWYHNLMVVEIRGELSVDTVLIAAHDFNALRRPLGTYSFASFRCLHFEGVYI